MERRDGILYSYLIMIRHWLVKSEPSAYAWEDLAKEGKTSWTGVRNFQARNNLRSMKKGDLVLFYQSVTDPSVRGISRVVKEAYPDATAESGDWSCVDLEIIKPFEAPVTLNSIKGDQHLAEIALIKQSRLSVMPLTKAEYDRILFLGKIR
jgi:predicted RNA-binding protein with PUA-like domain